MKEMSAQVKRAIKSLKKNVERYSPRVEKKLSSSGEKADAAVVYSAAKYYPALRKLARQ